MGYTRTIATIPHAGCEGKDPCHIAPMQREMQERLYRKIERAKRIASGTSRVKRETRKERAEREERERVYAITKMFPFITF